MPWQFQKGILERDMVLRTLAQQYFSNETLSIPARLIAEMSCRYEATSWRRDAEKARMPADCIGTRSKHLFRAFRSRAIMPLSKHHFRNVLRGSAKKERANRRGQACLV